MSVTPAPRGESNLLDGRGVPRSWTTREEATSPAAARRFPQVLEEIRRLDATRRAAALYRSHPEAEPAGGFVAWLRGLLGSVGA